MALIKPANTTTLRTIDSIGRSEKRDVLFLEFITNSKNQTYTDFAEFEHRKEALKWLDDNGYDYEECFPYSKASMWSKGYLGHIYIKDVPFDKRNIRYSKLEEHFEKEDGEPKIQGIVLFYFPLDMALENAHQDAIPNKMQRRR